MSQVNIAAALVTIMLGLLAALHFYWGLGGRWPGHDDRSLVEMVVGRTRDMKAPDFWACLFVTFALLAAAALVALHGGLLRLSLPDWVRVIVQVGFWTAFAVFAARGVAGFVPAAFRYAEGTPFARLNLLLYSPLCLAIAAGFVAVHFTAKVAS
jgi:hypothetical protein